MLLSTPVSPDWYYCAALEFGAQGVRLRGTHPQNHPLTRLSVRSDMGSASNLGAFSEIS